MCQYVSINFNWLWLGNRIFVPYSDCLFFHPDQQAFIEDNLAACTVGSLIRQIRIECFLEFVRDMVTDDDPNRKLDDLVELLKKEIYQLMPSSKHVAGRKLGRLEPSPSLKHKNAA